MLSFSAKPLAYAALALGLIGAIVPAIAQQQPAPAAQTSEAPFSFTQDFDYVIRPDGLVDLTFRYRGKVLTQSGVQSMGTFRDTVSLNFDDYKVVNAATIKPDGRRVEVDPSKILVQAAPASPDALHFFVDQKTYTVIFPELAVGDEVEAIISYRGKEAVAPGGESRAFAFARTARRTAAKVTIRAPKNAGLQVWQRGLEHEQRETGGEVFHTLLFKGQPYSVAEAGTVNPFDFEPAFAFSTFKDWQAVANAFWARGAGKSDPTPAITAKAKEVTLGATSEREKAERVFNWVTRNVRYVNIVLGAGGWVPREGDFILKNLYGDCKDHATLMRAMLRALDIKVDYALVNIASRYAMYPLPLASFDHIILYLPGLNLYVDPTNSRGQFGAVDLGLQGKPALRFNGESASFSRIPVEGPDRNLVVYRMEGQVSADGKFAGATELSGHGAASVILRGRAQGFANEGLEASATKLLRQQNWRGTARFNIDGARGTVDPTKITSTFEIGLNAFDVDGDGMRLPLGPMVIGRLHGSLLTYLRQNHQMMVTCIPARFEEHITIRFEGGAKLRKMPTNLATKAGNLSYTAEYSLEGNVFRAKRVTIRMGSEATCDKPAIEAERPVIMAIARDLNRARFGLSAPGRKPKAADGGDDVE